MNVSVGKKHWLNGQLQDWVRRGVCPEEIAESIRRDLTRAKGPILRVKPKYVLAVAAGVLTLAATWVAFGFLWPSLSPVLRLPLTCGILLASQVFSAWALLQRTYSQCWKECAAVALALGAGVFQILLEHSFHLQNEVQDQVLLWLALTFPIPYLFHSVAASGLFLGATAAWVWLQYLAGYASPVLVLLPVLAMVPLLCGWSLRAKDGVTRQAEAWVFALSAAALAPPVLTSVMRILGESWQNQALNATVLIVFFALLPVVDRRLVDDGMPTPTSPFRWAADAGLLTLFWWQSQPWTLGWGSPEGWIVFWQVLTLVGCVFVFGIMRRRLAERTVSNLLILFTFWVVFCSSWENLSRFPRLWLAFALLACIISFSIWMMRQLAYSWMWRDLVSAGLCLGVATLVLLVRDEFFPQFFSSALLLFGLVLFLPIPYLMRSILACGMFLVGVAAWGGVLLWKGNTAASLSFVFAWAVAPLLWRLLRREDDMEYSRAAGWVASLAAGILAPITIWSLFFFFPASNVFFGVKLLCLAAFFLLLPMADGFIARTKTFLWYIPSIWVSGTGLLLLLLSVSHFYPNQRWSDFWLVKFSQFPKAETGASIICMAVLLYVLLIAYRNHRFQVDNTWALLALTTVLCLESFVLLSITSETEMHQFSGIALQTVGGLFYLNSFRNRNRFPISWCIFVITATTYLCSSPYQSIHAGSLLVFIILSWLPLWLRRKRRLKAS